MSIDCNCYALRRATRRVSQFFDQVFAHSGLRATQYMMLFEVDRLGPISLLSLARHMIMDRATIGHNIRPLQAKGYLTLRVGQDRRSREVSLTAAGRKILARTENLSQQAQAIFEAELGADEAAKLRTMLRRVAETEFSLDDRQVNTATSAASPHIARKTA